MSVEELALKLNHSLAEFCKLNLVYDSDLPSRTISALIDKRSGWYNWNSYITGWHLLAVNHTKYWQREANSDFADVGRLQKYGLGIPAFTQISQLLLAHHIPHTYPDSSNIKGKPVIWQHNLDNFIDEFIPELMDADLVELGKEISENYQSSSYRRDLPPPKNSNIYREFCDRIDEKFGIPKNEKPSPDDVYRFIHANRFEKGDLKGEFNLSMASSITAETIYTICQNKNNDPIMAEYLKLREKYLFEEKPRSSDNYVYPWNMAPITLKLWQDFTEAAFAENKNIQLLKENLDRLNNRALSRKQFGFPVSLCPKA